MSWFRLTRGVLVLAAILLPAFVLSGAAPASKPARKSSAGGNKEMIERGRYVTTICGCNDCHTPGTLFGAPDFSRQLSGTEVGWSGPWGVSYPRNLTPDKETGLGSWTDDQIMTAFRTGKRPDGRVLLPPMPWQMYANLNDKDAHAVVAFLRSLQPVSHKVPDIVPPGQQPSTPVIQFPAPGAWDAPRTSTEAPSH